MRGDSSVPTRQIHAYFNLGAAPAPFPVEQSASRILLSTESPRYGGLDASAMVPGHILAPYECVVLKPVDEENQ
jgi:hypothetical protein